MKEFDVQKYKYVKDKNSNVWRYSESKKHYIKLTPWKDGEDRRVNVFEIEQLVKANKLMPISKLEARTLTNKRWDDHSTSWVFNGQTFEVKERSENKDIDFPMHTFVQYYIGADAQKHSLVNRYRLGYYNGDLVWWWSYHYYPQTYVYKFESIDKEPDTMNFWYTDCRHIKPIFNKTIGKYI